MDIKKTVVNAPTRQIQANWSIDNIIDDILSVQPMTASTGHIFTIAGHYGPVSVFESNIVDGKQWHSVTVPEKVIKWLRKTFVEGTDFVVVRHLKGVWVDMKDEVLVVTKLKFS